jgi:YegS/Rv2252/BmrU family lipid kinase
MASGTTHVIANPVAGGGRARRLLPKALEEVGSRVDAHYSLSLTRFPGDAVTAARCAATQGARLVIAIGGDGTIHEVANGLLDGGSPINPDCHLGIVDCGTGHGLAQSLGLPGGLEDQVEVIHQYDGLAMDLGRVTARREDGSTVRRVFASECQVGLGGNVVAGVRRCHKVFGGPLGFGSVALATALRQRACPTTAVFRDGGRVEEPCMGLTIGNGSCCGGGMKLVPDARVDDGRLDVLVIRGMGFWERLLTFPRIYTGRHVRSPQCAVCTTTGVSIETAWPAPVAADGEILGTTPCAIQVLPAAIRVCCPAAHWEHHT